MSRRPITRDAVVRLLDTRYRVNRIMWQRRAAVIRAQLVIQRGTYA